MAGNGTRHEHREDADGGDHSHAQGCGDPARPRQSEIPMVPGPARRNGLVSTPGCVHVGTVGLEPDPEINDAGWALRRG